MALILPKHLQAEIDYKSRERKVKECKNVIEMLVARSIREDLEVIVHEEWPRLPELWIKQASDKQLWEKTNGRAPQPPKYLYMSREDFYDICDDPGIISVIESYGLEPIWSKDKRPGRVSVLTEKTYQSRIENDRFHDRTDDLDVGILQWMH